MKQLQKESLRAPSQHICKMSLGGLQLAMKYVLEHWVRTRRNNTGMEPQSYWMTEAIVEKEYNSFPSLGKKSKFSDFSLAYVMPVEMILCSHTVSLCAHLSLYMRFEHCQFLPNFTLRQWSEKHWTPTGFIQISSSTFTLLTEGGTAAWACSCTPDHPCKGREATKDPSVRKAAKELAC